MPSAYAWTLWLAPALMALVLVVAEGGAALLWRLPMYPAMRDNEARGQFADARARCLANTRYGLALIMQKTLAWGQAVAIMTLLAISGDLALGLLIFLPATALYIVLGTRTDANEHLSLSFMGGIFRVART